jgi:chaperonin GroES
MPNVSLFSFPWIFCLILLVQVNAGKVIAVGSGGRAKDGSVIPITVKEGDMVLLPEYGGTEVKIQDKEYVF